jgi:hypothetical protein
MSKKVQKTEAELPQKVLQRSYGTSITINKLMRAIIFMCLFLVIPLIPTSMSGSSPFEGGLLTALSKTDSTILVLVYFFTNHYTR